MAALSSPRAGAATESPGERRPRTRRHNLRHRRERFFTRRASASVSLASASALAISLALSCNLPSSSRLTSSRALASSSSFRSRSAVTAASDLSRSTSFARSRCCLASFARNSSLGSTSLSRNALHWSSNAALAALLALPQQHLPLDFAPLARNLGGPLVQPRVTPRAHGRRRYRPRGPGRGRRRRLLAHRPLVRGGPLQYGPLGRGGHVRPRGTGTGGGGPTAGGSAAAASAAASSASRAALIAAAQPRRRTRRSWCARRRPRGGRGARRGGIRGLRG